MNSWDVTDTPDPSHLKLEVGTIFFVFNEDATLSIQAQYNELNIL